MNILCKYYFIIITVVSSIFSAGAQDTAVLKTSVYFEAPLIGRNYIAPPIGEGSPYLYDNWLKGDVVYDTGDTIRNKMFKFDCFKNELIWMSDGKSMIALDYNLIRSFTLFPGYATVRMFEKTSLKLPLLSDTLVRYLEVLSTGKMNLYAFRRVAVYSESVTGSSGLFQVNSYSKEPVYYIRVDNLPVKQVRLSKKSLRYAYPEFSETLKKILRDNHKGEIRSEYQMVQMVQMINQEWK